MTDERKRAEILLALLSKPERFTVRETRLPESGRTGYELTVNATIVIDSEHLRTIPGWTESTE